MKSEADEKLQQLLNEETMTDTKSDDTTDEPTTNPHMDPELLQKYLKESGGTFTPRKRSGLADTLVWWVKRAGAPSEKSYDFDGFLSYHAEAHALGMGIAGGYMATAHGEMQLFGMVYAAAVYGKAQDRNEKRTRILQDIAQEWHYALMGLVVGSILGASVGRVLAFTGIDLSDALALPMVV